MMVARVCRRAGQRGFTLMELIMVIIIMGALSAVAYSRLNTDHFDVVAAAGELVQAIRFAQDKSMSHSGGSNYQVSISGTGYQVTRAGSPVVNPVTGSSPYTESWSGIAIDTSTTIVFDAYGDPGLGAPLTITLSKGADSATVTVEDVTGFAR